MFYIHENTIINFNTNIYKLYINLQLIFHPDKIKNITNTTDLEFLELAKEIREKFEDLSYFISKKLYENNTIQTNKIPFITLYYYLSELNIYNDKTGNNNKIKQENILFRDAIEGYYNCIINKCIVFTETKPKELNKDQLYVTVLNLHYDSLQNIVHEDYKTKHKFVSFINKLKYYEDAKEKYKNLNDSYEKLKQEYNTKIDDVNLSIVNKIKLMEKFIETTTNDYILPLQKIKAVFTKFYDKNITYFNIKKDTIYRSKLIETDNSLNKYIAAKSKYENEISNYEQELREYNIKLDEFTKKQNENKEYISDIKKKLFDPVYTNALDDTKKYTKINEAIYNAAISESTAAQNNEIDGKTVEDLKQTNKAKAIETIKYIFILNYVKQFSNIEYIPNKNNNKNKIEIKYSKNTIDFNNPIAQCVIELYEIFTKYTNPTNPIISDKLNSFITKCIEVLDKFNTLDSNLSFNEHISVLSTSSNLVLLTKDERNAIQLEIFQEFDDAIIDFDRLFKDKYSSSSQTVPSKNTSTYNSICSILKIKTQKINI